MEYVLALLRGEEQQLETRRQRAIDEEAEALARAEKVAQVRTATEARLEQVRAAIAALTPAP